MASQPLPEVPVFEIVPPSIVKALAVPRFTVEIGPATAGNARATAIPSQISLFRIISPLHPTHVGYLYRLGGPV
jgi:hypothetical protein